MNTLQVAGFLDNSTVNGTGLRSVLFLSGCPHHCPDCQNEEMQDYHYGETVPLIDIQKRILKNSPLIDGITLSGGEPFEQVEGLIALLEMLKPYALSVWCYTGYLYEDLLKMPQKALLLPYIDFLVDGLYEKSLKNEHLFYRGSSNQRILRLQEGKWVENIPDTYFK